MVRRNAAELSGLGTLQACLPDWPGRPLNQVSKATSAFH